MWYLFLNGLSSISIVNSHLMQHFTKHFSVSCDFFKSRQIQVLLNWSDTNKITVKALQFINLLIQFTSIIILILKFLLFLGFFRALEVVNFLHKSFTKLCISC